MHTLDICGRDSRLKQSVLSLLPSHTRWPIR